MRYAATRIRRAIRPPVTITATPPGAVVVEHDVAVPTRDGTVLRVNVHRPPGDGPFPTILCAHPYGKDRLPRRGHGRDRFRVPAQYRLLRQTGPIAFSDLTTWEAPDPAWWAAHGYAVVNGDLRGCGTSDGVGALLTRQEGEDVADLVEWAAAQPWSTGRVGMLGVSYLAITQWHAAAQRPGHLHAIVPWEGFTDPYRALLRPGGVAEVGFSRLWARGLRGTRQSYDLVAAAREHPVLDDWWTGRIPDLADVDVPVLVCGSFSDNNLHGRGSFDGFERVSSSERHLVTHRTGKWHAFYRDEATATQLQFFDRHLREQPVPVLPRVRLEVRETADRISAVRDEHEWPLARTVWTPKYLSSTGLGDGAPTTGGSIAFDLRRGGVRFGWTMTDDVELTGPMALRLYVSVDGTDDVDLIVGVEKWRDGHYVGFEGSYGFGRDRVTTGWQSAARRALDPRRSRPFHPVPTFAAREPLRPGEVVPVDIALGPSATLFRRGEQLRLVVAGRWLWPRNPLTGQFPAAYATRRAGTCTVHWGADRPARLLVPVIPPG